MREMLKVFSIVVVATSASCGEPDAAPSEDPHEGQPESESDTGAVEQSIVTPIPIGATADQNGVAYIPITGYAYVAERFDWLNNFKSNGSKRHDFRGATTADSNQCVVGYFIVDGPDSEELAAQLASGPHNNTNPGYADTYDIGITNFIGTRARVRYEATHPTYVAGPIATIAIGNVRKKWVGITACKLNRDENGDGTPDATKILGYVDTSGLDASGRPRNLWLPTLDLTIPFSQVWLKTPATPYVATIGKPELAQATIRIDRQGASYQYRFIAYRRLAPQ